MINSNKPPFFIITIGLFLLLLTPLIVARSFFFPFITGKAFFFRIIVEVIFVVWLFLAWREPAYRSRRSGVLFAAAALVAIAALATIFGQNPYHSFWSNFERMDGLISYLHLLAYFLVIGSVFRSEKIWHWFFRASLAVSVIVCGFALVQLLGVGHGSQGKIDATLGNSTYLAGYALFHCFIALWFLARSWKTVWLRYFYIPLALLEVFVLYKTTTRGTLLGLLAGLGLAALILVIRKWQNRQIRHWALAAIGVLVILVSGFWLARGSNFVKNSPTLSRFASISATEATTESRLTIWQMSLRGFKEHSVFGWGPENFNLVFNQYYNPILWPQEQWFDRSHNIFLDWLITTGILGLAAYLALFVSAFYYLWRSRHHSELEKSLFSGLLTAYLVHNIFVFDNLVSYLLFFSLLAYLACHFTSDPERSSVRHFQAKDGVVIFVLLVALSGSLYYANFRPMSAGVKLIQAISPVPGTTDPNHVAEVRLKLFQEIFAAGTFLNREAVEQLFPIANSVLGDSRITPKVKTDFANLSLEQVRQAVAAAPTDARLHLLEGAMLDAFNQPQAALESFAKASELSPQKQAIIFRLAGAYFEIDDKKKALELAERAFRLDERFPEARLMYALVLLDTGDLKKSDELLATDPTVHPDERFINAYVKLGLYDRVLPLWQAKAAAEPGNLQVQFSLAAAYLAAGQRQAAIDQLKALATTHPEMRTQADYLIGEIRAGRNPISR